MIEAVVRYAIHHRKIVLLGWFLLAIGLLQVALSLQLDALPDITSNQVQVLTRAAGLTPQEVEQRVTRPLEASFGGIAGLVETRSLSRYGLSAITVVFEEDIELLDARQLVTERMATAAVAGDGVDPPELGPMSGGLGEVVQFTVSSASRTPSELLELVELRVAPILKTVPGIVEVNTWGGAQRTFEIHAEPSRLALFGLEFGELREGLSNSLGNRPGAALESSGTQVLLRSSASPKTPEEVAALVLRTPRGDLIRLADVASVVEGQAPRLGAATKNGVGETVYVMTQMLLGANARDVSKQTRERLVEVQEILPKDVSIDLVYDRSELVDSTLRTVGFSLLEGGLLVAVVLFFMLGSARAGLIVAMTIVVAMLGATASMAILGISGNLMSLGALDFGLLVDGAVVIVENVFHSTQTDSRRPWAERVSDACTKVARPSFFGVLVILLVYVPVLTLTGVDGKLFRPMALTVVLALSVALIFTLTFIPAASAALLRPKDVPQETPRAVRVIALIQRGALAVANRHPWITFGSSGLALGAAVFVLFGLGTELAPTLDEGSLVVQTERAADTGILGAVDQSLRMERALIKLPEIANISSRIGSPAVATDTMGLEQADVFIELAPRAKWRPGMTRPKLLEEMASAIERVTPGADAAFTQPIQMRFNELLGGAPYDVVVSVRGQDLAALRLTAQSVRGVLEQIPGVQEPRILAEDEVPLIDVQPDGLRAMQAGLSTSDILEITAGLRLGVEVGSTFVNQRRLPVMLRVGAEAPHPSAVGDTVVPGHGGAPVQLKQVAHIKHGLAPGALYRHNGERRVVLGFNVRGRDLGQVVEDAKATIKSQATRQEGTRLTWGGQFETLQNAQSRLTLVIPAVFLLVVIVLMLHFRKLQPVLWVAAHVPFAAVGGVFALAGRGMPLSISAAIGFIALWGVAIMNGTVLVTEIESLQSQGSSATEATIQATLNRTRPVAMTALVAALGFVPMALATGPGSEVQRPLATVVVGGLMTSTLLTLVVLPSLRLALHRWKDSA